jgi:hypothetical protein
MRTKSARLDAAVVRFLRVSGWRAARRAARRQTNLDGISGGRSAVRTVGAWRRQRMGNSVVVRVAAVCGEALRGDDPRELGLGTGIVRVGRLAAALLVD